MSYCCQICLQMSSMLICRFSDVITGNIEKIKIRSSRFLFGDNNRLNVFSKFKQRFFYNHLAEIRAWETRHWKAPAPHFIKQARLLEQGLATATWVETGTFTGDTAFKLSEKAHHVYTVEPSLRGTSENVLPNQLPTLRGDVSFWLDGHYSGGDTFLGENICPIENELANISNNINSYSKICVVIDDIRCFNMYNEAKYSYPSLDFLVDWSRKNGFYWMIDCDMFIARNYIQ